MQFPKDDYTPYGYLDVPAHTRNLTPRGVLRSYDLGFRWHYPAYAGTYGGRRETYRAGLRVGINGALELPAFDSISSPYHSKNLFTFDLTHSAAHGQLMCSLVGEHTLRATLEIYAATRVAIFVEYTRLIAANGEWGESGLVGRVADGALIFQGFEDGEAFILWVSQAPTDLGITTDLAHAQVWASVPAPGLTKAGFVTITGEPGDTVSLFGVAGFTAFQDRTLEMLLARGKTVREAYRQLEESRRTARVEHVRKIEEDNLFWERAPRLEGDWPAHWRRGLVYDLETLRMMAKQPVGIYRHRWDAMQIQAPRVVLAEAAFDALLLAYADLQLARELMLGTFVDAPEPNVPCSREDGSYNMVSADGTVCGTAPEWGYPWLVLEWLDALEPDQAWLERIYPYLAEYLDWWLIHRRDSAGWLVYACSWESGQDLSPRFGDQPLGGGHPTWHMRPVDLQAAFAHASQVMARFATALGRTPDSGKWTMLAAEFSGRTDQLWNGARYADFDAQVGQFTSIEDIMLLAPLALGVAKPERIAASRDIIKTLNAASLVWPMFVWTPVEAALAVDLPSKAAELAWAVCDRVYRFWDSRELHSERTLPGIACEYWPLHGRCGGEGYGWGAFSIHLIIHTLLGFSPTRDKLILRPNLPLPWREPGRRYSLHLYCRARPVTITLEPLSADRVPVTINTHSSDVAWADMLSYAWEDV